MIITKEYIAELNPDLPIDAEEWRPIVGYTGLVVSNYGNIKRLATSISYFRKDINRQITRNMPEKMYSVNPSYEGYLCSVVGDNVNLTNHRQVALAFVPNPNPDLLTEVDHIDNNSSNPYYRNLQWLSPKQNRDKSYCNVLASNARPVVELVSGIQYPSIRALAATFKYPDRAIQSIQHALSYKHWYVPKYDIVVRYVDDETHDIDTAACLFEGRCQEIRKSRWRAVRCITTGTIYPSAIAASRALGLPSACVSEVLSTFEGYYKKSKLQFEYVAWEDVSNAEMVCLIPYFVSIFRSRSGGRIT